MNASLWKEVKRNRVNYAMMVPFGIVFLTFTVIPVVIAIFYSFTYFNVLEPPVWVGFANYKKLFLADDIFLIAVKNTLLIAAVTGPVSFMASLLLAWMINELRPRVRAILTLLFYAPALSNIFVVWMFLFSGDAYGFINGFLLQFGFIMEPILWLTDPKYMKTVVIIIILWSSLGTSFLAFIAGLQNVDKTLYEAGAIDGVRNRWQELWYITLPYMKPQLMFGAVMSITASFGIGAVITPLVGFPSTDYAVHTIVHHLEDYGGIRFEMGYASAIATLLFLLMIGMNKLVQNLLRRVGE